jgi:hypothetical protein
MALLFIFLLRGISNISTNELALCFHKNRFLLSYMSLMTFSVYLLPLDRTLYLL